MNTQVLHENLVGWSQIPLFIPAGVGTDEYCAVLAEECEVAELKPLFGELMRSAYRAVPNMLPFDSHPGLLAPSTIALCCLGMAAGTIYQQLLAAAELLQSQIDYPSVADEVAESRRRRFFFWLYFGTLLRSGCPIFQALDLVAIELPYPEIAEAVAGLRKGILAGQGLAEAMGSFPKMFDAETIQQISALEQEGRIDELGLVLDRLRPAVRASRKSEPLPERALFYDDVVEQLKAGVGLTAALPAAAAKLGATPFRKAWEALLAELKGGVEFAPALLRSGLSAKEKAFLRPSLRLGEAGFMIEALSGLRRAIEIRARG